MATNNNQQQRQLGHAIYSQFAQRSNSLCFFPRGTIKESATQSFSLVSSSGALLVENDARGFSKQLTVPAWKESALSSPPSFSLKKRKLIVPAIPNSDFFKEKFQFSSLKDTESSETVREERTATPQKATILGESMKEGETICKPNPNDVLFVRGKECEQHSGNLQFRKLCWNHRQIYKVASRKEKRSVARQIFGIVQNKTPSGRFLRLAAGAAKHATPESDFVVADEEKTLVRITRILREQERQADDAAAEAAIQQAVASLPKIDRCASNTSDSQQPGFAVASKSDERCRRDSKTATEPVSSKNGQGPVIIQDPHRNDVIFGRGNCHTRFGNMQFRQFCWDIRKTYDETTRLKTKRRLVLQVYEKVRNLDPPGRFLRKTADGENPGSGVVYVEAEETKVLEKIAQALREKKWIEKNTELS